MSSNCFHFHLFSELFSMSLLSDCHNFLLGGYRMVLGGLAWRSSSAGHSDSDFKGSQYYQCPNAECSPCIILWWGWALLPSLFRLQTWPKGSVMLLMMLFKNTEYSSPSDTQHTLNALDSVDRGHFSQIIRIMNIWKIIMHSKQSCLGIGWRKSIFFQVLNCLGKTGRE